MWHTTVRPFAADLDLKLVARGHNWTCGDAKVANWHARPIVHAKDGLHRKFFKQAVVDHALGPRTSFFGWLKNDIHGTVKIFVLNQLVCGIQEHRRVTIVAASMHLAFVLTSVGERIELLHRQCIKISPQTDRLCAGRTTLNNAHDTRAS